ncbi:hypothetical protein Tco_0988301 [Tanacetum coccineum]|uniref:Uncharacterized protein n=1 Tax=Tanacetum coccineum TaxID=301880 RepID=A0ABQ5ERW3_9ASTR
MCAFTRIDQMGECFNKLSHERLDSVNDVGTPTKKQVLEETYGFCCDKSLLEAIRDIVSVYDFISLNLEHIKILCGVDHDDLKSLFHVSKPIREVVVIEKKWHYEYSTPKKILAFRCSLNLEEFPQSNFEDMEAPNAPKQSRMFHPRWSRKNLATIRVSLFALPPLEHIQ